MRATLVITVLSVVCIVSMGFGAYKLLHGSACAVEISYANSKATYVGYSL